MHLVRRAATQAVVHFDQWSAVRVATSFGDRLSAVRQDFRQRDVATRAAAGDMNKAQTTLAHLQRRSVVRPQVSPEHRFGRDRWNTFDQEVKSELLGRLYQQHPDRARYEAYQKQLEEATVSVQRAKSWHEHLLHERAASFAAYLALRAMVIKEFARFVAAPPPEHTVTESMLLSSWTDPLVAYCEAHEPHYNRLKWYDDRNLPAPRDRHGEASPQRADDPFHVGYTAREQLERKRRPWL
jgi:hypothetical protein